MIEDPDNSREGYGRDAKGRWRPGVSGNPDGPPRGSRHRASRAAEALLNGDVESLTRKAVEMALDGDSTAMRLCLERILPPAKSRPVEIDLPDARDAAGVLAAFGEVVAAMGRGELAPDEAATMAGVLEAKRRAIETVQLEERLRRLEEQAGQRR